MLEGGLKELSANHLRYRLPLNWTGRFLGTGNGGVDGCIQYEDVRTILV